MWLPVCFLTCLQERLGGILFLLVQTGMTNRLFVCVATLFVLLLSAGCRSLASQTAAPLTPALTATRTLGVGPGQTATGTPGNGPHVQKTGTLGHAPGPSATPAPQGNSWVKTYGGNNQSLGGDVIQASDGGFLIVGSIGRFQGDDFQGGVMLIKTDPKGETVWQKVYGGDEFDAGWSLIQTGDGGYLIAGETASFGAGSMDAYLIKVDQQGNEIWSKTYGGPLDEGVSSILPAQGGGYLLVGNFVDPNDVIADPGTAGYAGFAGRSNIYVVKIDQDGNQLWSHVFESQNNVIASTGAATPDGGFVILATIIYYPEFDNDVYLLKIDDQGEEIWSRTWQEDAMAGYALAPTADDQFLITGPYEISEDTPADMYLMKVDAQGEELWRTVFGEPGLYEFGQAVIEASDGNYMVLASSVENLYAGKSNVILSSLDKNGGLLWMKPVKTFYDIKAQTMLQHLDGGYVITGSASSNFGRTYHAILIKTDAQANVHE